MIAVNTSDKKYAGAVTVGTKGQIVIPKEVRAMFGIEPGDTLILLADETRGIAIPPRDTFRECIEKMLGGENP